MSAIYQTIKVNGRVHVITESKNRPESTRQANYRGTKKALCGVLKKEQTLEQWIKKHHK